MSADSFLEFMAHARELPEDSWRPRRDRLLSRLGLVEARKSRLSNYSFGMLRKVALAGALLHSPPHLLLDEPTAGLDPWSVRALKDIMQEERDRGASLLVSSHDLDTVAEVADHMGIILKGRLIRTLSGPEIPSRRENSSTPLESLFLELTGDKSGAV
jgi:ABC-2 type transport system ATP-binding protein